MNARYRSTLGAAALALLLPMGSSMLEAAPITAPDGDKAMSATPIDRLIDLAVAQLVTSQKLAPAAALVAREQMQIQFNSLSKAAQQQILAQMQRVNGDEAAGEVAAALHAAVTDEARQALAAAQAAAPPATMSQAKPTARLGGDGDLVFVATAGPCRVWDSRFGMGPLAAFSATQVYGYSNSAGYSWSTGDSQGGTGTAGSGNCTGTVFPATPPVSVVATVVVVNTSSTGALRAWNGGTTLTVGGILGWNAGDVLSNTTVIPMNRSIAAYPRSGFKRDFGLYNNSPTAIDTIVDVVGYFIIDNKATPLDCVNAGAKLFESSAWSAAISTDACPAGYTPTGINCSSKVAFDDVSLMDSYIKPSGGGVPSTGTCRFVNRDGQRIEYSAYLTCCRVPGR
ncbi:MAG: hypothetical protein IT516_08425 [Burkholderiales bacterium]|nr:hypothetical protein [Burkholderiales bacterium]